MMGNGTSAPEDRIDLGDTNGDCVWEKTYAELIQADSDKKVWPKSILQNAYVMVNASSSTRSWTVWKSERLQFIFGIKSQSEDGGCYLYLKPTKNRRRRTIIKLLKGKNPGENKTKKDKRIFILQKLPQDPTREVLINLKTKKYLTCDERGRLKLTGCVVKSTGWMIIEKQAPTEE